jgi:hypothetical protein
MGATRSTPRDSRESPEAVISQERMYAVCAGRAHRLIRGCKKKPGVADKSVRDIERLLVGGWPAQTRALPACLPHTHATPHPIPRGF